MTTMTTMTKTTKATTTKTARWSVLAILDCGRDQGMHSMFVDPAHKRALATLADQGIAVIVRREGGAVFARLA